MTQELETRLAYMDDALNQLSETVYAQAREIERLDRHCRELESRVKTLAERGDDSTADETPPHY